MNIDDLILHPSTERLVRLYTQHLPQGLVIEGALGSGVATVAHALAREYGSRGFVLLPKKKVKNELVVDLKEGRVVIEDIRRLYELTRTKQSEKTVYVIDTGEKSMTTAAQNAFLKLLEEPREGLHFIIATHQKDLLLPTIVSRCQTLSLLPITDKQTAEMIDMLGISNKTKSTRLSFVGRGSPALIARLANDEQGYEARVKIMTDAKILLGNDAYAKLLVAHRYKDNRSDALTLLDDTNYQLRTVIRNSPDQSLVKRIESYSNARDRIAFGGNIRLHLSTVVI